MDKHPQYKKGQLCLQTLENLIIQNDISSLPKVINEFCDLLKPSTQLPIRVQLLKEVLVVILKHKLDATLFELDTFWKNTKDMFDPNKTKDTMNAVIPVLCAIVSDTLRSSSTEHTSTLLDIIVVIRKNEKLDIATKLKSLRILTDNGKNIAPFFPKHIVGDILQWLQASREAQIIETCLQFLSAIMDFSYDCLDEEYIIFIIEAVGSCLSVTTHTGIVNSGLLVYKNIVQHGTVPPKSIVIIVSILCITVSKRESCDLSEEIMNTLLKSGLGYRTFQILCDILIIRDHKQLHRGAIFFVGMATWGKNKIDSLEVSYSVVLGALSRVLSYSSEIVAYEVMLVIRRVIKKYGTVLQREWDIVMEILAKLEGYIKKGKNTSLQQTLKNALEDITAYYLSQKYLGDTEEFFKVIDLYKEFCAETTILIFLDARHKKVHPAYKDWLVYLRHLVKTYLIEEKRDRVKSKVLDIIRAAVWKFSMLCGDDVLENVLRFFFDLYINNGKEICEKALQIITDITKEIPTKHFSQLVTILDRYIMNAPSELQTIAAEKMIDILKTKFNVLPCNEASLIFTRLIKNLDHENEEVREKILSCVLTLRSNRLYQLELFGKRSKYLRCHSNTFFRTISSVLPVTDFVDGLLDRVMQETKYSIYIKLLNGIKALLINKYLFKDLSMSKVCTSLCTAYKSRSKFIMAEEHLEKPLDQNACAVFIEIFRLLAGFKDFYAKNPRTKLVDAMVFSVAELCTTKMRFNLLSKCLDTLTIFVSELTQELVENISPIFSFLLKHVKNNYTQELIISALEFLDNLGHTASSEARTALIDDVFQFCLSFADVTKHPYYISYFVYRVLVTWFMNASFQKRQSLVKTSLPILHKQMTENKSTLSETAIDFFLKYAYLSFDPNLSLNNHLLNIFQNHSYRAWTIGNGILTAQSGKFGYVILRYRRPTGTIAWTMKLVNTMFRHKMEDELFQGVGSNDIHEQMQIPYLVQKSPSEPDLKQLSKLKVSTSNVDISGILEQSTTVMLKEPLTTKETSTQDVLDVILSKYMEPTASEQQIEEVVQPTNKSLFLTMQQQIDSPRIEKSDFFQLPSYDEDESSGLSMESEQKKPSPSNKFGTRSQVVIEPKLKTPRPTSTSPVEQKTSKVVEQPKKQIEKTSTPNKNEEKVKPTSTTRRSSTLPKDFKTSTGSPKTEPEQTTTTKTDSPVAQSNQTTTQTTISQISTIGQTLEKQAESTKIHPNFPYLFLREWPFLSLEKPQGLQVTPALTRALNMFDLIPSEETTKFGVLYVGEGQTSEDEILANTYGSPRYFEFLRQLGEFISLQDYEGKYTGGLDSSDSMTDGEYALMFRDELTHAIFHVASLMPNYPSDPKCNNKKRHIGNDYVNIIYCDKDQEFPMETLTGQFNFVLIVIYPHEEGLNRVDVMVRKDIELSKFGPLQRHQIVSDSSLSSLVRLTALHADMAARAYRKAKGEFVSNWEERLRQITVIKERFSYSKKDSQQLEDAMKELFE